MRLGEKLLVIFLTDFPSFEFFGGFIDYYYSPG